MSNKTKEQKFNTTYTQWVQALFRFMYFKTRSQVEAEEIVQDTFVRYWEKMDAISDGKVKSYLFIAAKNIWLNKIAHSKVVQQYAQNQEQKTVKSPHYDLEVAEFQKNLELTIQGLPDAQREVFLMNRVEGYKYREIAEMLNISQKAVEKRMSLALKTLRKLNTKI